MKQTLAGYSGKPLAEKLGVREGFRIAIVNAPADYKLLLGRLPASVRFTKPSDQPLDIIQVFSRSRGVLEKKFPALKKSLAPAGALWVSWPKGSSKVETDLNENVVREIALAHGMVDVKVCAVDETWSGLKLVFRLKDRR